MVIAMIKPGFHMIALIAAIAEKKNIHRSCGNHSPAIAETTIADIELLISQRLLSLRSLKFFFFFLSDRSDHSDGSDHMKTGL